MYITEQEARERFAGPDNLANRFNIGKMKRDRESYAQITESGISESEEKESQGRSQIEEPESVSTLPTLVGHGQQESQRSLDGPLEHRSIGHAGRVGPRLTVEKRTEIAIAAKTTGIGAPRETQSEIAQRFGISRQGVAEINAGHGKINNSSFDEALERARDTALEKLMLSLGLIDEERMSKLGPRDLSLIASNMAKVVERTIPDKVREGNINLTIYAPELRKESSFDVVEIG
jgi:hypothetical protein